MTDHTDLLKDFLIEMNETRKTVKKITISGALYSFPIEAQESIEMLSEMLIKSCFVISLLSGEKQEEEES